ncbi:MAG: hypothetical protein PF638_04945 [Candidatus Delongbacteria bacterium]|jgi:hypothetical protein|nr:hypothetical protein [Candidatus Delongbacteria bacterium]
MRRLTTAVIIIVLAIIQFHLKAETEIDYKSWKNLSDKSFVDSLKKYEGKNYKLDDYEYRKKTKEYKAPFISEVYPKNYLKKGFNIEQHLKEYIEYFKTLNLYGIDPYRLYYNRIDLNKIDTLKKEGLSIIKAYNYIHLPHLDADTNWEVFNNSSLMIGVCKNIVQIDGNTHHQEFEVTEIIRDRYNFYKIGDVLKSSNHYTNEALIQFYKLNGMDYKHLLNRKKINIGDTCLLSYDRFILEKQLLSLPDNNEIINPYSNVGFTKIESGKYGSFKGEELDLKLLIDKYKKFDSIIDVSNFFEIEFKGGK